jgi:hypothetical protein
MAAAAGKFIRLAPALSHTRLSPPIATLSARTVRRRWASSESHEARVVLRSNHGTQVFIFHAFR